MGRPTETVKRQQFHRKGWQGRESMEWGMVEIAAQMRNHGELGRNGRKEGHFPNTKMRLVSRERARNEIAVKDKSASCA